MSGAHDTALAQVAMQPEMRSVLVTPALAAEWLEQAKVQRNLRLSRVARYTSDMLAGRWGHDVMPIVFDTAGNLANGQHRLHAVVRAGVPITFWVLTGEHPEAIKDMDSPGIRTIGDQLKFAGVSNYQLAGSIARTVLWYRSLPGAVWSSTNEPTNPAIRAEIARAADAYNGASHAGEALRRALRRSSSTAYGALRLIVAEQSPNADSWDEWHRGVVSGALLSEDDPRLALRAFFLREDARHWGRSQSRLLASMQAWNKWVRDEPMKLLRSPRREELPMKDVA